MEKYLKLIKGLSEIILNKNRTLKMEEEWPSYPLDEMDRKIALYKTQITALRRIREELENIAVQNQSLENEE